MKVSADHASRVGHLSHAARGRAPAESERPLSHLHTSVVARRPGGPHHRPHVTRARITGSTRHEHTSPAAPTHAFTGVRHPQDAWEEPHTPPRSPCLDGRHHPTSIAPGPSVPERRKEPMHQRVGTVDVRVHALLIEQDADGFPVAYPGYATATGSITDGVPAVIHVGAPVAPGGSILRPEAQRRSPWPRPRTHEPGRRRHRHRDGRHPLPGRRTRRRSGSTSTTKRSWRSTTAVRELRSAPTWSPTGGRSRRHERARPSRT